MPDGGQLHDLWVYLAETPLLWLTTTLVAYVIGDSVSAAAHRHPLVNPVVIAAGLLILVLTFTDTSYQTYFEGAQFVHFLLGPATVALAKRQLLAAPLAVRLTAGFLRM